MQTPITNTPANLDWNKYYTVKQALAAGHKRVALVSDGIVSSVAPMEKLTAEEVVKAYMHGYDIPQDAEPGWCDGSVQIWTSKGLKEEFTFHFNERGKIRFTMPCGELRADGFRY